MGVTINIDTEMKEKCYYFAAAIVLSKNQFKRFPNEDIIDRIERTFAGKLGEYVFLKYLENKKLINQDEKAQILDEMFKIFDGQHKVDSYDFKTKGNKRIDIKTAYKTFHSNLVVNKDQFEDIEKQKDYYIAVKLKLNTDDFINLTDELQDESNNKYANKILKTKNEDKDYTVDNLIYEKKQVLSIKGIKEAEICGYISRADLNKLTYNNGNQYGYLSKAYCKYISLYKLNDIEEIIKKFE